MDQRNCTRMTTIHLLGFQTPQSFKFLMFFLFLMIYCMTMCGNLLIITLVSSSQTLHSPMYFFLSHLSILDILLATDIFPNMIRTVLVKNTMISFSDCLAQFYFFIITVCAECYLLTVMAYDRYLAICKPMHYSLKMNYEVCWILVMLSWMLGISVVIVDHLAISKLQFCGPNVIDHFFCDFETILQLSCLDTAIAHLELKVLDVIFTIFPFSIICISYFYIIGTIMKMSCITGKQKVFSTCSSHLTAVSIYYGTLAFVYMVPSRDQMQPITKLLSLLYTVITPMINPMIYSLRNRELKIAAGKLINNLLSFHFS